MELKGIWRLLQILVVILVLDGSLDLVNCQGNSLLQCPDAL